MNKKIVSVIVTSLVLVLLVASGPANALILTISLDQTEVFRGENLSFIVSADTQEDSEIIDQFILNLTGPSNYICRFDTSGVVIEGCEGAIIEKISEDFGYGYGYGYNHLEKIKFNVTLDTVELSVGRYRTFIHVLGDETETKRGDNLDVNENRMGLLYCSVRGKKGSLIVDLLDFGNKNKLNFYIANENAAPGQGYLTGKIGNTKFTYGFEFVEVLSNNATTQQFAVSGEYRIGLGPQISDDSIITITGKKLSLEGSDLDLQNMDVTFKKGC